MNRHGKKGCSFLGIVLVVIDQVIKVLVKTNMSIGEHFNVLGNWFQILFIENEGMAFGMKFGGAVGKVAPDLLPDRPVRRPLLVDYPAG